MEMHRIQVSYIKQGKSYDFTCKRGRLSVATILTCLAFYLVFKISCVIVNHAGFSFTINHTIQRISLCTVVALIQLTAF